VIFTTNGYEHGIWDDAAYPQHEILGFLKKDELQLLVERRQSKKARSTATPMGCSSCSRSPSSNSQGI